MNTTIRGQMSESKRLAMLLAVSGGLMDAYTYLFRDKVFANAQTGNILLLGICLAEKDYAKALQYFFPISAFVFGVILAEVIHHSCTEKIHLHWRQIAVFVECMILFFVGFLPQVYNLPANSLVSFACGIQVECFRKVHGNAFATTMCIGNLRSGTQAVCNYVFTKNKNYLRKGVMYYCVILSFMVGAVLGNRLIFHYQEKAIWCSSLLLLAAFFLMFFKEKKKENFHEYL